MRRANMFRYKTEGKRTGGPYRRKKLYNSILHACVFTQVDMGSEFQMKNNLLGGDYH